jgi:hypothetical protein
MKHWSENEDHLVVYHGTHIKNVPEILKNGINNKDPKTGMVSVAIGSHGADVAHGYAAMSGEYGFRQAGQKAITVPHEDRAIIVAHLPMDWVHQHVDRNFGGNPTEVRQRLADPELHRQYVAKTGSDFSPTKTPELRFSAPIPAKYIVGVTQKRKPMKTFKQFVEESLSEEVPTTSASGGGDSKIKNFDPVLKFNNIVSMLKRRPAKDTFNHPETAKKDAARSASGVPGLP